MTRCQLCSNLLRTLGTNNRHPKTRQNLIAAATEETRHGSTRPKSIQLINTKGLAISSRAKITSQPFPLQSLSAIKLLSKVPVFMDSLCGLTAAASSKREHNSHFCKRVTEQLVFPTNVHFRYSSSSLRSWHDVV